MPTLQTDHVNMMPPKHPLLSTIQAAISKRQISKHPRGTPLNSILKFVHDHDGVSDENRVVDALEQGTKTGLFRKGKFGWYSSADDPVTRKRKRVDDTKDETRLKEQWARTRINKEESTRYFI